MASGEVLTTTHSMIHELLTKWMMMTVMDWQQSLAGAFTMLSFSRMNRPPTFKRFVYVDTTRLLHTICPGFFQCGENQPCILTHFFLLPQRNATVDGSLFEMARYSTDVYRTWMHVVVFREQPMHRQ